MPIHRTLELRCVGDADFEAIDKAVMRCAYATQNRFGRLFDERIYENDLAARLRAEGFEVHTQVPVGVVYGSFDKTYYLDLVVNHMVYELKVVAALLDEHEAQALNYAMLLDVRRIKLINFGDVKVRGHLLRNAVSEADRHQAVFDKSGWRNLTPQCECLFAHLCAVLKDWGTHLSSRLYNEALIHHFGGEAGCVQRLAVNAEGAVLGTHPVPMHSSGHGFAVTALTRNQTSYRRHLETLIAHTDLRSVQWINLNHSRIEFTTVEGDDRGMGARE